MDRQLLQAGARDSPLVQPRAARSSVFGMSVRNVKFVSFFVSVIVLAFLYYLYLLKKIDLRFERFPEDGTEWAVYVFLVSEVNIVRDFSQECFSSLRSSGSS